MTWIVVKLARLRVCLVREYRLKHGGTQTNPKKMVEALGAAGGDTKLVSSLNIF